MRLSVVPLLAMLSAAPVGAAEGSFVDATKPFTEIADPNRQAEAWGMCSAAYRVLAELLSDAQPSRSQQLKELSNGASVAVTMTMFSDGMKGDGLEERFNALWEMSKLAGTEIPRTQRTWLLAEAESSADANAYVSRVVATVEVCASNLKGQQMYIDMWRELAKSGLLESPSK